MPRADIGGWATSAEAVFNLYKKYLSNAKVCGLETTGCFAGRYKRMNGSNGDYDTTPDIHSLWRTGLKLQ